MNGERHKVRGTKVPQLLVKEGKPAARKARAGGRGHGAAPAGARREGVAAPAQAAYYGGHLTQAARGFGRTPSGSSRQVSSPEWRRNKESAGSLLAASLTLKPGPH